MVGFGGSRRQVVGGRSDLIGPSEQQLLLRCRIGAGVRRLGEER